MNSGDRKRVLEWQVWADIKTEGAGRGAGPSEDGQRPWVQEHILEQDTVPLSFLVPWLPCHLEEGTEESGGAAFP